MVRKKYKFEVFTWNEKIYKDICMIAMFTMRTIASTFASFGFMILEIIS
ncbi:MAG: hypothetical protein ACTSW6_01065 [Candidatus Baldrarchaeia archaeon]